VLEQSEFLSRHLESDFTRENMGEGSRRDRKNLMFQGALVAGV
jgi:hypothetical protein